MENLDTSTPKIKNDNDTSNAEMSNTGTPKMKVYLSGTITADPNHKTKFEAAKRKYKQKGYEVLSPIETPEYKAKKNNSACLFASIKLLEKADWLIQLDNPEQSKGMQIEEAIADYCSIPVTKSRL